MIAKETEKFRIHFVGSFFYAFLLIRPQIWPMVLMKISRMRVSIKSKQLTFRFMLPGEKWHSRRKLLSSTFHSRLLHDYLKIVVREANILVSCLKEENCKPEFDIIPYAKRAALDIICGELIITINLFQPIKFTNNICKQIMWYIFFLLKRIFILWIIFEKILVNVSLK